MASIRERGSKTGETSWAVLYRVGKRQCSHTFSDPDVAEKFRRLVDLIGPDRALVSISGETQQTGMLTVHDLAEQFLTWKARSVTARTMTDYRRDYENWIRPWLGHRPAELVDEFDVQKLVDHMATSLAPKSVAGRHMLLHSMYEFGRARVRRLVTHNPCQETELPRRKKTPPKGATVPEVEALLTAAWARNRDAHDLILYFSETGWRFSEGTALSVPDVEDDDHFVWTTVSQVFRIDGSGRQVLSPDEAKSYAAFRRIRMLPRSTAMIRRRMVGLGSGDLLFTNSRGRPWNQNTFLRETWPRIRKDAGVDRLIGGKPITPHHLRHTHVAVLGGAGVPAQEIQRRIGHESIATTMNVYGGMIGDISDAALERAGEIMAGRVFVPGVAPAVRAEVLEASVVTGQVLASTS